MKSDVESAFNPCRRFFVLEVESHIVAAGMKELGIEELGEMSHCVPDQRRKISFMICQQKLLTSMFLTKPGMKRLPLPLINSKRSICRG